MVVCVTLSVGWCVYKSIMLLIRKGEPSSGGSGFPLSLIVIIDMLDTI